ncbi:hypothetical protein AgCh_013517 [Apium graveolens]
MANPLYIQILKNGPFTPMERVDESTDGDMVIPTHFAPKDPSKYTESEKEKVSLDSFLGESEDEKDTQFPVIQVVEQKNKGPQKRVVLELEKDEYYTLDELDEMDQSMAYLARKFSNIRVKKPRKPKKVKRIRHIWNWKQKGKSWDDTDNDDEDEEVGNYALMALEHGESSTLKSEELEIEKQSLELQLIELKTVKREKEYLKNKLKCANKIEAVLREKIEKNEVKLKSFRNASQLVANSSLAAEKLLGVLNSPGSSDKDEVGVASDLRVFLNGSKLVGKNQVKVGRVRHTRGLCGLCVPALAGDKGKATVNEDVPAMLRKVDSPLFKECEVNFSEEELLIKLELADEYKEIKK